MAMQKLFPTLIREAVIGDQALRSALETACRVMSEDDVAGNEWCEREGYDGYTSYASLNDLPHRFPEFAELEALLVQEACLFAAKLHWDLDGQKLKMQSLWVNILAEGGSHSGHIHPGSIISGTYYVAVPEGAGQLKLEDPRLGKMMAAPALLESAPPEARRFIYLQPRAAHAILWESWLRHEVMPNRSENPRISISFNIALA